MQRRQAFIKSFGTVLLACVMGCNDSRRLETFPVTGTLLVGSKPAGGAHLAFHAVDQRLISRPVAVTETDGSFRLMTHAADDGAPAGEYIVTIFWRDESHADDECEDHDPLQHDRFHGLYVDSTKSPLRASGRPGPNELIIQAQDPKDIGRIGHEARWAHD